MNEKKPFIKENIIKRSTAGRTFRRIIIIVVSGIIIGLIGAVTMAVSKPTAEKLFGEEESTTAEIVIIPRDELPEIEAVVTEPEKVEEIPSEPETEPVEDIVQDVIEGYKYSMDDLNSLWNNLGDLCDELDNSIVVVESVKNATDWFNNEVEKEGSYSGIVIAETNDAKFILTVEDAVEDAESVEVVWENGVQNRATIKAVDTVNGLAILRVYNSEIAFELRELIKPVSLGSSYVVDRGDILVAVGSPESVAHSVSYGWASYIARDISIVDGRTGFIYSGDSFDAKKGTWVVNSEGELIGWVTDNYQKNSNDSHTVIQGLSEYKSILEKMLNNQECAYLGIVGTELTEEMEEDGISQGIYVNDIVDGSPAYEAGIQPGDIITYLDTMPTGSMNDFCRIVDGLSVGSEIGINVMRAGFDGYVDIDYKLTVGKRQGK